MSNALILFISDGDRLEIRTVRHANVVLFIETVVKRAGGAEQSKEEPLKFDL